MLLRTPSGVTSPTTVTFFVAMSMSKEVTPGLDTTDVLVNETELAGGVGRVKRLTFHLGEVLLHFPGACFAVQGYLEHNHLLRCQCMLFLGESSRSHMFASQVLLN